MLALLIEEEQLKHLTYAMSVIVSRALPDAATAWPRSGDPWR